MNPVVLYFASGESLYAGAMLLFLAVAAPPFLRSGWHRRLRNLAAWLGLLLVVMASPLLSSALYFSFLTAFLLWLVVSNRTPPVRALWQTTTTVILTGLLLFLPSLEVRHRNMPRISEASGDHLVVIGDSISAGIDPRLPSWPIVFQQTTGVPVKNLALPGADLEEGLKQAVKLTPEDKVVLIEMGGNDLLSGVSAGEFARRLEALLVRVTTSGRIVAMFELPLLPHWISYGQAQRQLASKYGVYLIPKRYFAAVISGGSATLDGLHLSELGTHRLATLVTRTFASVLRAPPDTAAP